MTDKLKKTLFWFVILQPFLDLDFLYRGKMATILPFTIPTIVRILGVLALAVLFAATRPKIKAWIWIYAGALVLYGGIHLWHMTSFKGIAGATYGYSTFGELFYLFRMVLPLVLIYITQTVADEDLILRGLAIVSGLFSGTIVISNLFAVSLKSYETGTISGNIFTWFMGPLYGYSHSASKGFFYFTNTLSAILLMLAPIVFYLLIKKFSWKTALLALSQTLAMLEVGTKVALYGLLASLVVMLVLWLVHVWLLKNESFSWRPLVAMVVMLGIFAICYKVSPAVQRYEYEIYWAKSHDSSIARENALLARGLKKYQNSPAKLAAFEKDFLAKYYKKYALNKKFISKSYPYEKDPQFWIDMLNKPASYRLANRKVEQAMLDRVVEYNDSPLDKWLGIGYMRETNIFNLERDFVAQRYSLGIVGAVLYLVAYPAVIVCGGMAWLLRRERRTFYLSSLLFASCLILGASYMSGNVLDFPTSNLLLAFVDGGILAYIKKKVKR